MDEKVKDHILTLEELAEIDFDLSKVREDDPIKMALELIKELRFHGIENKLSDLNLPSWAEDALLLVYKLEYMKASDTETRIRLLRAYDSMEGSKDIPPSKKYLLPEHLGQRVHEKTTDWTNEVERSRAAIEVEIGRQYTGSSQDLTDLRAREQYDLAAICERAQYSLLKECSEDIADVALARGHLSSYNQFMGRINPMKLADLLRVKKRLDTLDKSLFNELVIGHVRDETGGYINQECVLLEEKLREDGAFEKFSAEPSCYDSVIGQLNQIPENKYMGKKKVLQLERPFRVLGTPERSERAYVLTEMFLGVSRVHGMGDDWEGLTREAFNEQFSNGSYCLGNAYSITSEGTIQINPEGTSEEIQRRMGVAVAVLEGVLKGDQNTKFRFVE